MIATKEEEEFEKVFENIPGKVIARFHTNLVDYRMEEGNNQVDIDTGYNQDALNMIIKNMFDLAQTSNINFDFLINGKLLLGTIKSHLVRYQISCEQVVDIQYILAYQELTNSKERPVEDWISCLCEVIGLDHNIGILSASFDGTISFHQDFNQKKSKIKAQIHDGPIKAIRSMPSEKENIYYIFSGGLDEEIKVSKFGVQNSPQIISINAHEGSVLALDFNPDLSGHICTGGSSGALNVWRIPDNFLTETDSNEVKTEKKKKRKTNNKSISLLAQNQLHKDIVNSMCWITSSTVATGSSDHSIKLTDIEKMRELRTYLTKDSITSGIDFWMDTLLSSHEDGYIRSWDLRIQGNSPVQTYKSHSRFASCVKKQPRSNRFATGSYDETVKVWDIRSVFPLQTIMPNYDKIFSLAWVKQGQLVSAGSNPFLTFHTTDLF